MEAQPRLRGWPLLAVLPLLAACGDPSPGQAPEAPPAPAGLSYIEMPPGSPAPCPNRPTLIAIHGLGDSPEGFSTLIEELGVPVRTVLPRAPDPWGQGFAWFPFRFEGNDPETLAEGIGRAAGRVAELVTRLSAGSRDPIVVTGFSQGAMIAFALAARNPGPVRLVIPIGGMLPPQLRPVPGSGASFPVVRALHGEADEVVPIGPSRETVDAFRSSGADAELLAQPGVGHAVSQGMRKRMKEYVLFSCGNKFFSDI